MNLENKEALLEERNKLQEHLTTINKHLRNIELDEIDQKLSKYYGNWYHFIDYHTASSSKIYIKDVTYYDGEFGFNGIRIDTFTEDDTHYITISKDNNGTYDLKFGDCIDAPYNCNSNINALISFLETGRKLQNEDIANLIKSNVEYYISEII